VSMFIVDGTTACDPDAGSYVLTYDGEAGDAIQHNGANADIQNALNSNDNLTGVTATLNGGATAFTIAFAANTGDHPMLTIATTGLQDGGGGALVCAPGTITIAETVAGKHGTTLDLIDHDAAAGQITAIRTVENRVAAGTAVVETAYISYTYDDTDSFNLAATPAATRTQFETALNAVSNLTTNLDVVYRTGALTTGVSGFTLG